jgi:hypothetical protein
MTDSYINTTAIFGEVKKHVLSKDFKFGQFINVFGQTTVDFSNADINGAVILDSTQLFGEIRIKAPANWHVVPEVTNIFAVIDDKRRNPTANITADKVLVLRGVGIFAAIKIIDCNY